MRAIVAWVLISSLFLPMLLTAQSAYSYTTSIEQNVQAKWNSLNFTVCIFNTANAKYEDLFIKAIEEWKSAWPYFNYMLEKQQNCSLNVSILKNSVEVASGSMKARLARPTS